MKKLLLAITLLMFANSSFSATAYFTGRQVQVQTITYQYGWNCEYRYAGRTFWQVFTGFCPTQIEIQ